MIIQVIAEMDKEIPDGSKDLTVTYPLIYNLRTYTNILDQRTFNRLLRERERIKETQSQ